MTHYGIATSVLQGTFIGAMSGAQQMIIVRASAQIASQACMKTTGGKLRACLRHFLLQFIQDARGSFHRCGYSAGQNRKGLSTRPPASFLRACPSSHRRTRSENFSHSVGRRVKGVPSSGRAAGRGPALRWAVLCFRSGRARASAPTRHHLATIPGRRSR
jgi:hypothetical protein